MYFLFKVFEVCVVNIFRKWISRKIATMQNEVRNFGSPLIETYSEIGVQHNYNRTVEISTNILFISKIRGTRKRTLGLYENLTVSFLEVIWKYEKI